MRNPFRRTPNDTRDFNTIWEETKIEYDKEKIARREVEHAILDTIGEATDDLADRALTILDHMPREERTVFMHNVFRRLALQTIYNSPSLESKTDEKLSQAATHLGSQALIGYGSGVSAGSNTGFDEAVIDASLPRYQQAELEMVFNQAGELS